MIRVLGNSSERVPIKDLNDCIYYKQVKEFTDSDYESSQDLKRAIQAGKIVKIEQVPSSRGSIDSSGQPVTITSNTGLSVKDLKSVLQEMLPKDNGGMTGEDLRSAMIDMAPLIVDMVRQEVSKISVQGFVSEQKTRVSDFVGPEYVPTVSTEGMTSSIEAKQTEVSSNDANDALKALRELQGIK